MTNFVFIMMYFKYNIYTRFDNISYTRSRELPNFDVFLQRSPRVSVPSSSRCCNRYNNNNNNHYYYRLLYNNNYYYYCCRRITLSTDTAHFILHSITCSHRNIRN